MRVPIEAEIEPSDLTNPESSIDRIFSNIKQLRLCHKTTVEILQLDLAFTLPHPKGNFLTVNTSKVANKEHTHSTLLTKSDLVIYPMYTKTFDARPNGRNKMKTGTVIIKTKNWSLKSSAMTTFVDSDSGDNYVPVHFFIVEKNGDM